MKKIIIWIGLALALTANTQANAALISGDIGWSGGAFTLTHDINGVLTGIDFGPSNNDFTLDSVNGDFIPALAVGDTGKIGNFASISPLSIVDASNNATDFLTIAPSFTFELTSVSVALDLDSQYATSHVLTGSGIFHLTGFEDTIASFNLALLSSGDSELYIGTAVPEPGTLALFGMGLLGLTFTRRNKKV